MSAPRSPMSRRGAWAEDVALAFLRRQGMEPVARNYRSRHGEIDLVMRDGTALVFAEVRYRRRGALVDGMESVDAGKQRRLLATAEHFLQRHRRHGQADCRFDVLSVSGDTDAPRVQWVADAFQA